MCARYDDEQHLAFTELLGMSRKALVCCVAPESWHERQSLQEKRLAL